MSQLFSPLVLAGRTLPNRIVVAPMCQYSANDGCAADWHLFHLPQLALSGAGLVVLEATGVERHGRISHGCLGLYSDACETALHRVLGAARRVALPGTLFGIQLAHAGRKASVRRMFEGGQPLAADEDPWPTIAPSAIPFADGWHTPRAMTRDDMERVRDAFVAAAARAVRLGFDAIELHAAHGYLMHEFLSPLSNRRDDDYGGSFENRMRFPLEVAAALRGAVPADIIVGARITGSDWHPDGLTVDDAVTFARALRGLGLDFACVSSGGLVSGVQIPTQPGYQVPFAARVRAEAGIASRAVGLIVTAQQAEDVIANGAADMVALGRALLHNPRWPWHAAEQLGADLVYPPQYSRATIKTWPGASLARA